MSAVCSEVSFNVCKLLQVWTILLTCSTVMEGYTWTSGVKSVLDHNAGSSPVFDDFTIRELEATEGQTLLLPCTVRYLGDKVVSWIRSRDLHILTSGPFTFSSDSRFEAVPSLGGDFWGLRIRGVHLSDAGQYECQVNTDPKMSLALNLSVSVSGARKFESSRWLGQALIKGPREVYVRDGSLVTFTCEISPLSTPQSGGFMSAKPKVRWLHDNKELLFEPSHSHISTKTLFEESSRKVIGILKISKASWRDSGQYTCLQMSVKSDSIKMFVVESEHSEAMQRDYPVQSCASKCLLHLGLVLLFTLYYPT
ncbi:hemicentin-1-like isoform X1 [Tribolium madens]|uniref:hemicentin-1-like isoform X1 n=1 Tax=Tribolium madens TaxID=41895 RepID=UPI001CF7342A|nr:hemicentin-1-like isoform X1 [Tribolium madens]